MTRILILFSLFISQIQILHAQNPDLQIKNGILALNGTRMSEKEWSLKKFEKILGQANRTTDRANIIHTWDQYGIVAFEENNNGGTGKVLEVQLYFNLEDEYDFLPATVFEGLMTIDNYSFKKESSLTEIKAALPNFGFNITELSELYAGGNKKLQVFLNWTIDHEISSLAFGPREEK